MNEVKIFICGNDKKKEISQATENLKSDFKLNILIKDCSNFSHIQNIEYYFSLINDIQYFNAFILNYEKKEDIFQFFKSFNSEAWGITNECYPFFIICEQILSKKEIKNFINDLNNSKKDEYKIKFGNILFFNEIEKEKEEFQNNILTIYNCFYQEAYKIHEDSEETINILIIGVKNSGKSFLVNRLLWETRALSMENNYTTKLNSYKHKKYPIVFYDISGFHENEDEQINNLNSKIDEFNKEYKNLKNKIHIIFYVIDCNSVRILQKREKELIENIFKINIPIFIVGQKAKVTNINNFIRKTKFELSTLNKEEYNEKIEILKNRIFCLDPSNESIIKLLKSVYDEFIVSKQVNIDIINSSSSLNNEDLINRSFSDNININNSNDEEKKIIEEVYRLIQKSIFFNNFIESLNEVYINVLKIKEKYLNENYCFKDLNSEKAVEINKEIEKEFLKLFDKEDLNEINKLIVAQKNKLIKEGKNIEEIKYIFGGSAIGFGFTIFISIALSNVFLFGVLPILGIFETLYLKKRNDKAKAIIDKNIENSYKEFERKYIWINLYLIRKKAQNYNKVIDEFEKYLEEFQNEDYNN